MSENLPKPTFPLSESAFYVLLALRQERHGYEIVGWTESITGGDFVISAGSIYNILIRMESHGWITVTHRDKRRTYYRLTELGESILESEIKRIARIYQNSRGLVYQENTSTDNK